MVNLVGYILPPTTPALNNYAVPPKLPALPAGPQPTKPTISIREIGEGDLATYWGIGQIPRYGIANPGYTPPGKTPAPSQVLKIPFLIRYLWEDPIISVDFDIWQGYSGDYVYSTHTTSFNQDLTNVDPSFLPSHIHFNDVPWPFGTDGTLIAYAIEQVSTFSGGDFGWSVSGGSTEWFSPSKVNEAGPLSWRDYVDLNGALFGAMTAVAELEIGGFPGPQPPNNYPLGVIQTYDPTPQSVGVGKPIFLGTYSVEGIPFGQSIAIPYHLTIIDGYDPPARIDWTLHSRNLTIIGQRIFNKYGVKNPDNGDYYQTDPVFDNNHREIIHWPWIDQYMVDYNGGDYLSELLPYVNCFFGTYVIHILMLSAPRIAPPQVLIQAFIRNFTINAGLYPRFMAVIFSDSKYMTDSGLKRAYIDEINTQISNTCNELDSCGFKFGGEIDYTDIESTFNIISSFIDTLIAVQVEHQKQFNLMPPRIIDKDGNQQNTVGDSPPLVPSGPPTDGKVIVPGTGST